MSKLIHLHKELASAALDPSDEDESEWYRIIGVMHGKLMAGITGLREMRDALKGLPASRKRIGELYMSVGEAAFDFEAVEKSVRPQLQYAIEAGRTESYDTIPKISRMLFRTSLFLVRSARPGGFDTNADIVESGPEPEDWYEPCRQAVHKLLRRLEATLAARQDMAEPPAKTRERAKRTEPSKTAPPQLRINEKAKLVFWGSAQLPMNSHDDFTVFAALWRAKGGIVTHLELHRTIRPKQVSDYVVSMGEATPQVKEAVSHIRKALHKVLCPYPVEAVKTQGYRLRSPDE